MAYYNVGVAHGRYLEISVYCSDSPGLWESIQPATVVRAGQGLLARHVVESIQLMYHWMGTILLVRETFYHVTHIHFKCVRKAASRVWWLPYSRGRAYLVWRAAGVTPPPLDTALTVGTRNQTCGNL